MLLSTGESPVLMSSSETEGGERMDPRLMLIDMIQTTKKLWEIYKTEEIRVYLEYLKDLYDREIWKIIK